MFGIKLSLPASNIVQGFEDDPRMVRQFGRFYNPIYGLDANILKSILEFSTYQSLINGEFYFLDDLSDQHVIEVSKKVKHFFESQEIDFNDHSKWPAFLLMRLHFIYKNQSKTLVLDEL